MSQKPQMQIEQTLAPLPATKNPMEQILALIEANPAIDPASLKSLIDMANEQEDRHLKSQFYTDKTNALHDLPAIEKRFGIVISGQKRSSYAKWIDIQNAIGSVLRAHNLAINHDLGHNDKGQILVTPILQHTNGYVERGEQSLFPIEDGAGKNNVQAIGSTRSYATRYTTCAALNLRLIDLDTDGRSLMLVQDLTAQQQAIKIAMQQAIEEGGDAPQNYLRGLSNQDRLWIIGNDRAAELASHANATISDRGEPVEPSPLAKANKWLDSYEKKCQSLQTSGEFFAFKEKNQAKRDAIKKIGNPALESRMYDIETSTIKRMNPSSDEGQAQ